MIDKQKASSKIGKRLKTSLEFARSLAVKPPVAPKNL
jgi:uncharacterized protein YciW